jgi:hypothetical protein
MHAREYQDFTPFLSHILYDRNISLSNLRVARPEELIGDL